MHIGTGPIEISASFSAIPRPIPRELPVIRAYRGFDDMTDSSRMCDLKATINDFALNCGGLQNVDGREAKFVRRKIFACSGAGELNVGDAWGAHGHREDRHRIARGLAAGYRLEALTGDDVAFRIEGFE
jgi:hypothetical protein